MHFIKQARQLHYWIAPWVTIPLLITVFSGMTYRLAQDWGGLSRDQVHWLMVLHQGEWLGKQAEPVVVMLNGLGLLWMLITGIGMLYQRVLRNASKKPLSKEG